MFSNLFRFVKRLEINEVRTSLCNLILYLKLKGIQVLQSIPLRGLSISLAFVWFNRLLVLKPPPLKVDKVAATAIKIVVIAI